MDEHEKILKILEEQNHSLSRIESLLKKQSGEQIPKKTPKKSEKIKHQKTSIPAMLLYFKEDSFFDKPRTLSEIVTRFKEESRSVKSTGLTLPLQKLVRSRALGRVLTKGKWHYVAR